MALIRNFDLIILIPVLDDSEALLVLLEKIDSLSVLQPDTLAVLVVNDGGGEISLHKQYEKIDALYVLTLVRNFGHQRAIAIGLAYLAENFECGNVVVMDGDGEDRPSEITRLIDSQKQFPEHIIFASRAKRFESRGFRFLYFWYKILFRVLTGVTISFGNFCIIPGQLLKKIVYVSDILSHFAAGTLRSKLPITTIPIERGKRYSGCSKMVFTSLVVHAFRAFAVYLDVLSMRLLLLSLAMGLIASIGFGSVIWIRCFTDIAIAEWATITFLSLAFVAWQGITSAFLMGMLYLAQRIHVADPPLVVYHRCVGKIEYL